MTDFGWLPAAYVAHMMRLPFLPRESTLETFFDVLFLQSFFLNQHSGEVRVDFPLKSWPKTHRSADTSRERETSERTDTAKSVKT